MIAVRLVSSQKEAAEEMVENLNAEAAGEGFRKGGSRKKQEPVARKA